MDWSTVLLLLTLTLAFACMNYAFNKERKQIDIDIEKTLRSVKRKNKK